MPRSKDTPRDKMAGSLQLTINFGDDATQWFQNLSAAVAARPKEIEVQFVGGCMAPPYEIIALRNALLRIPSSIRLVTTALVSLPPLTCAAWLVGDERRIARDSVVWIPELPEDILRHGLRRSQQDWSEGAMMKAAGNGEGAPGDPGDLENGDDAEDEIPFGSPGPQHGPQQCERDLRALADVINEWFPCWEFNGSCLTFDDLVAWGVVKAEWCFGGSGSRNRPEAPAQKGRARARVAQPRYLAGTETGPAADSKAPPKQAELELAAQKLEQGDAHDRTLAGGAQRDSEPASAPETAAKPSDL